jgi:hypothetical protein
MLVSGLNLERQFLCRSLIRDDRAAKEMTQVSKIYKLVGLGAVVVAAGAVTTTLAIGSPGQVVRPVAFAPIGTTHANPKSPQAALDAVLATSGAPALRNSHIGAPPAGSGRSGPWLYVDVKVPGLSNGLDVEPMWEADLIQGAVAEESSVSANLHDDFAGSTFNALLPDGTTVPDESGGMGDVARGQLFSTEGDALVEESIRSAAGTLGLHVISVNVLHADGPAPSVVAETTDPAGATQGLMSELRTLFGAPPRYDGYYLELRDATGNVFVRTSAALRTGAGRFWINPVYASSSPIKTLGRMPTLRVGVSR